MNGAQGLQPASHFQTLQLDPSAPRALVVEVYQALVRRARRTPSGRRLEALDAAYAAAMADDHEFTWPRGQSHYAVLHIDRNADEDVVRLAYEVLERTCPVATNSDARRRRDEALRILTNGQLRARYDLALPPDTITERRDGASIEASVPPERPRKDSSVPDEKKRGMFGFGRKPTPEFDARDRRLLTLRAQIPLGEPDVVPEEQPEDSGVSLPATIAAEVIFTAGPRAGTRVELNGDVLSLGAGKTTANLWRHGDRFLLRHSGNGVRVGGVVPALSIVVLEDEDDVQVGDDRLRFLLSVSASS